MLRGQARDYLGVSWCWTALGDDAVRSPSCWDLVGLLVADASGCGVARIKQAGTDGRFMRCTASVRTSRSGSTPGMAGGILGCPDAGSIVLVRSSSSAVSYNPSEVVSKRAASGVVYRVSMVRAK